MRKRAFRKKTLGEIKVRLTSHYFKLPQQDEKAADNHEKRSYNDEDILLQCCARKEAQAVQLEAEPSREYERKEHGGYGACDVQYDAQVSRERADKGGHYPQDGSDAVVRKIVLVLDGAPPSLKGTDDCETRHKEFHGVRQKHGDGEKETSSWTRKIRT